MKVVVVLVVAAGLLFLFWAWHVVPLKERRVTLVRAKDGDTFLVREGKRLSTVRLAGHVDAPEKPQPLGREATAYWKIYEGRTITLRQYLIDVKEDQHGRTLAYLYHGDKDLGLAMVGRGLAWLHPSNRNFRYHMAKARAKRERKGIHAGKHTPPWVYRKTRQ